MSPPRATAEARGSRNAALLAWYDGNRRPLPWRGTGDRWAILVSEVMLQQTQVSRVVPAFERFLALYPTPAHFAAAAPEDVIDAWGDLGYLRRARNLHRAASIIADRGWPTDLTALPGVGPYTAAAVAAFADGEVVAAVDINLRRVLSRWAGAVLAPGRAQHVGQTEVDPHRPGDWNQAMMDLGATVCRPVNPECDVCPVAGWCVDPTIVVTSRRQTPFAGSVRQARAAVLKKLAGGPAPRRQLGLGLNPATVDAAISALVAEGAVIENRGLLRLG